MKKLAGLFGVVILAAIALSACQTLFGRGHGPVDSFAFLPQQNPALSRPVQGLIIESVYPKVIEVVVPPGTDLSHLVATFSFNTEATISVISSGKSVAQTNGQTANNFQSPVLYSIKTQKDKQPWQYRVMVRHADQNPLLSQIRVVDGSSLDPAFNPHTMTYSTTVPYASTQVTIEANAQSPHLEKMTIGGHEVRGARASVTVPFTGVNQLNVPIATVAEDQTTSANYTVTVLRGQPDRNSKLAALSIENASINPLFSPEQMSYIVQVPYPTKSIALKAATQSKFSTVALEVQTPQGGLAPLASNGNPLSGSGAQINFAEPNLVNLVLVVTAQDGSTSNYTITVTRAAPDRNSLLAELQIPNSNFNPAFDPNQLQYNVEIPYAASRFNLVALPQSGVSSVSVTGARISGDPNSPNGATVSFAGSRSATLSIQVTAQDGSVRTYTLFLRRGRPDSNSHLATLLVTPGVLSPSFSPRTVNYSAVIPGSASSAKITIQTESQYATVSTGGAGIGHSGNAANGQVFTVPVASAQTRSVDLLVTAQDGSQRIYHVNVTREAAPIQPAPKEHNSLLSGIVVSGGGLAPAFAPSQQSYTVTVPTSQNRVSLLPIAESSKASVSVDGKPLGSSASAIELEPGKPRVVVIRVVAEDGSSSQYTVTMTRVLPRTLPEQRQSASNPSQPVQSNNGSGRASAPVQQSAAPSAPTQQQTAPVSGQSGTAQQSPAPQEVQTTLSVRSDGVRIDPHVWKDIRDAGDQLGSQAVITVRSMASHEVLLQTAVPVQIRQPGNSPAEITLSWESQTLTIPANAEISVTVAIPTQRGWYVHYNEVVSPQGRIGLSVTAWGYGSSAD